MFFKLTKEPDPQDPKLMWRTDKKPDERNTIQRISSPNMASFFMPNGMTELSPTTCACISKALYLIKTRSIDTEDKWIDCNTLYILASNISWHHLSLNASYTQNCLKCFEWIADRGRSTFIKPVLNKVLLDPKYQGQIYCLRMLFTDLEWHAPFQS